MRTMGKGIVDVHAPQGFAAETTSAAAILASSHMGFGLSTTQVCSGSILGSGVGKKLAKVRWTTARKILYGWLLTLPAAALVGGVAAADRADRHDRHRSSCSPRCSPAAGAIYAISKRAPVSSDNVNDSPTSPSTRQSHRSV